MDARCSSLDATEVHFVIDTITAAYVQESADVSMQAWLLNQQVQEVLLNSVSAKTLLSTDSYRKRCFNDWSLKDYTFEAATTPNSPGHPSDQAPSEPPRRRPAQEKLEKEIADYSIEIETCSKKNGGEHVPRVAEFKKLRAACEDKLRKLRAGYEAYQRWREANKSRNAPARQSRRPSRLASMSNAGEEDHRGPPKETLKKYRTCDIKDKLRALNMLAKGMKVAQVAKHFQTRPINIRYWRGQKSRLHAKMEKYGGDGAKFLSVGGRKAKDLEIDDAVPVSLKPGMYHKCGKCGQQFKTGIELRMHRRRRHGDRVARALSCDKCHMVFTQSGHLARHKLTHTGAKPFECETCHKSFGRKEKLRVHQLVHSLERTYVCAECGYRYATDVSLLLHRRIHRAN